ncbi:MAG TPA: EF-hand domain-containing protein [Candidatus Binatia bacterium]|nr:EF-hand domain-containing protein [Candidatus Binatia bacterium]
MLLRSPLAIAALALVSLPLMHLAQASKPDVDAFIQRWDADHDEAISRDELRNATGDRLDPLIDKMFHAIDRNHDGKLDKHELKSITGESLFWLFETRQRPAS